MTWLPTLAQMRDRVFYVLRDSERAFVTATEVDYWLNEGYLDLNARLRLTQDIDTGTFVLATGSIALPADCLELVSVWIGDTLTRVTLVDHDTYMSWATSDETPEVTIAQVWANAIEPYPLPADGTAYALYYISQPTELTDGGHSPVSLTPELAQRVVNYARAQAKWKEGEADEGDRYYSLFVEGLPGQPRLTHRLHPGRIDLVPEASPFDEEW